MVSDESLPTHTIFRLKDLDALEKTPGSRSLRGEMEPARIQSETHYLDEFLWLYLEGSSSMNGPQPLMRHEPTAAAFGTTHWTVILEAANSNALSDGSAFASLYQAYWNPLYAYVRRRGFMSAEAEDITQDFFTRLVSKEALSGIKRDGGKFRSVGKDTCLFNA